MAVAIYAQISRPNRVPSRGPNQGRANEESILVVMNTAVIVVHCGDALDRVAGLLREEWNVTSALLHGGHSSVCALGTPPGDSAGWSVGLRHPWDAEKRLGVVQLRDRALGTSPATIVYFVNQQFNPADPDERRLPWDILGADFWQMTPG